MRAALAKCSNTHPAFVSIRNQFETSETVNISAKQTEVLDRTLRFANMPGVDDTCAGNPFHAQTSYRGTKQNAMRAVIMQLDVGTYGDWRHSADPLDLTNPAMKVLEVSCSDGPYYLAFAHPADLNTAEIALDSARLMM
ncbi:hypothetical protein IFT67_12615 [Sphingomonas sp. CFBP 13728]|uniref:hypothetical protein n=1 Tax=Sphingomonas sp. CFBP 13728 TaxID=2775294 RepID=UPI0017833847|nr:hypothetical protein [Sphingomonas sp. CFBP 13728]MBD8619765.1 hypothetical protein [Sphingomonas sp. CFBP 13728]